MDGALGDLVDRSEAMAALIIDMGGFLIAQKGDASRFDTTTIAALASASFAATQAIATMLGETNFNSIYQEGEQYSMFFQNVDGQCLLVVIFRSHVSVGLVKYFSNGTIVRVAEQLRKAKERDPDSGLDLSSLNLADASDVFKRKR